MDQLKDECRCHFKRAPVKLVTTGYADDIGIGTGAVTATGSGIGIGIAKTGIAGVW